MAPGFNTGSGHGPVFLSIPFPLPSAGSCTLLLSPLASITDYPIRHVRPASQSAGHGSSPEPAVIQPMRGEQDPRQRPERAEGERKREAPERKMLRFCQP